MDFDLSEDQRLLKDSVDRLVADKYGFEQRRGFMAQKDGWSREMWAAYAEMGLLGLPFDEAHGGFGGGPTEVSIVMEAFGRSLVLEPYVPTVLLGGALVASAADEPTRAEILPEVAAGKLLLAFAHMERHSRWDFADVHTTAKRDGGAWRLDGDKTLVLGGDVADRIVVSARVGGGGHDQQGIGLFLVDPARSGVTRRGYRMQDGSGGAEFHLSGAHAISIGDPLAGLPVIRRVVDRAIAALCSEAVGVMAEMHAATVDYLKTRKQFGRPIGDFQALQHRSVDMYVALEQARSMALYATVMCADSDSAARRRAMSAAKVQIGHSGRKIGQEAVQLHGGIGMTMEYKVGHYFKRMTMLDLAFGDADDHLEIVADGESLFAA